MQKMNRVQLNRIDSMVVTCKKINRTKLNRINSNVEILKRDYLAAHVKEIARKQT